LLQSSDLAERFAIVPVMLGAPGHVEHLPVPLPVFDVIKQQHFVDGQFETVTFGECGDDQRIEPCRAASARSAWS
jgi:hypothetical protein